MAAQINVASYKLSNMETDLQVELINQYTMMMMKCL